MLVDVDQARQETPELVVALLLRFLPLCPTRVVRRQMVFFGL